MQIKWAGSPIFTSAVYARPGGTWLYCCPDNENDGRFAALVNHEYIGRDYISLKHAMVACENHVRNSEAK